MADSLSVCVRIKPSPHAPKVLLYERHACLYRLLNILNTFRRIAWFALQYQVFFCLSAISFVMHAALVKTVMSVAIGNLSNIIPPVCSGQRHTGSFEAEVLFVCYLQFKTQREAPPPSALLSLYTYHDVFFILH